MTQQPERRVNVPPTLRGAAPVSPPPNASRAKGGGGKNKRIANSLVALSSAAILSVYGLGDVRSDTAQTLDNLTAPTIAIATAMPTAIAAPASSLAVYQSPLFSPTTVAATSPSDDSAQGAVTTTAVPVAVTSNGNVQALATSTPSPSLTTTSAATSAPATAAKGSATATTIPPTATSLPLPRATPAATAIPSGVAKAPPAAVVATSAPTTTALYKDGAQTGTRTSRHGNISASVVVQGGKIVSAAITQCGTPYPCSDIAALPGQVVTRQGATVDVVSGATDSSQAYRGAIQNALAKAKGAA